MTSADKNQQAKESQDSQNKSTGKTVSLILGSGGARGLAHIGVIKWLEENGYKISFISGSSMGALVGGAYAAGHMDEFCEWFETLTRTDIIGLSDIAWQRSGLIKGDKLFSKLKELIGDPKIEELEIPFTAVATDIENEKEVWLQKGSLMNAIRASIALPMVFTPYKEDKRVLIDGGVLNPIPIAPTFSQHTELTIAVNLGGKPQQVEKPEIDAETQEQEDSWLQSISDYFEELKQRFIPQESSDNAPFDWTMYDISNKAFDSMQSSLSRQKLAAYPPDILIEISRDACGMMDFHKMAPMVELGYKTAEKVMKHHQS